MSSNPETNIEDSSLPDVNPIEEKRQEVERLRTECNRLSQLVEIKKKKFDEVYPITLKQSKYLDSMENERYSLNDALRKERKKIHDTEILLNYLQTEYTRMEDRVKALRLQIPKERKKADPIFLAYGMAKKELEEAEKSLADVKEKIRIVEEELRLATINIQAEKAEIDGEKEPVVRQNDEKDEKEFTVQQKEPKANLWISGSFWVVSLAVLFTLLGVIASKVPPYTLVIVIVGGLLALAIIGAFQLRNDEKISEASFLQLMLEAIKKIPLLKGTDKEKDS